MDRPSAVLFVVIGLSFLPLIYVAREIREKSVRIIGPQDGYWKYRVWLTCFSRNRGDELILALSRSFNEICAQIRYGELQLAVPVNKAH